MPKCIFTIPFMTSYHLLFRGSCYQFQQDGAPCHTSHATKHWLRDNNVRQLNGGIWPPCSPDLNPVERVWSMVTRALEGQIFNTKHQLWNSLQVAFSTIPPDFIHNLFDGMWRLMVAVQAASGGHTKYRRTWQTFFIFPMFLDAPLMSYFA